MGASRIHVPHVLEPASTSKLDELVVGRAQSLFSEDMSLRSREIQNRIEGARVLAVGGAGSIGAATLQLIVSYRPAAVDVVDLNENGLAELVRDLRARLQPLPVDRVRFLPLDFGSGLMRRLLATESAYDVVLNFAALKHVRSEKDELSLLQMLDTNLVKQRRFRDGLAAHAPRARYFAVSTDKAANPTSMMGASKRVMEDVIFDESAGRSTSSARFANVAFSNGSLLQSWLIRLSKGQPMVAPRETSRYFVTQQEAGEVCLLAACCAPDQHLVVPRLDPTKHLRRLDELAGEVCTFFGFEPVFVADEAEARESVVCDRACGRYPILLTPLDTSGEKPYEEFVADGESTVDIGMRSLLAVRHIPPRYDLRALLVEIEGLVTDPSRTVDKKQLVSRFEAVLDHFRHVETGRNLDQRL
jgi:FlaA1/EpsC-like NDP-sugar epimerase